MNFEWQDRRWHVRLYLWAEPVVARFFDSYSRVERERVHTNLCPYVRTLVFWLPLAFMANLVTLAAVVATLTYIPGNLFGWHGYLTTIAVLAAITGVVVLIAGRSRPLSNWFRNRRTILRSAVRDGTPAFVSVLRSYTNRMHEGICPEITITRRRGLQ